jgi:large subunit ribosomal protein L24
MFINKDDLVEVIAGDDKGTRGKVVRVFRDANKVIVEGVNRVYKHMKPSRANQQGGRLSKEMPVDMSNVALIDPATNKACRVGVKIQADGTKVLVAKKTGTVLRTLAKADPKRAAAVKK